MSYRKYVKLVPSVLNGSPREKGKDGDSTELNMSRAQNLLPMIYQGSSNRLDRYQVYDNMEQDPTISSNLHLELTLQKFSDITDIERLIDENIIIRMIFQKIIKLL